MKKISIIALLFCFNTVQSYNQNRASMRPMPKIHHREETQSIQTASDGTITEKTTIIDRENGVNTKTLITKTTQSPEKRLPLTTLGGDGTQKYCSGLGPYYGPLCCVELKKEGQAYNDKNKKFCSDYTNAELKRVWDRYQMCVELKNKGYIPQNKFCSDYTDDQLKEVLKEGEMKSSHINDGGIGMYDIVIQ